MYYGYTYNRMCDNDDEIVYFSDYLLVGSKFVANILFNMGLWGINTMTDSMQNSGVQTYLMKGLWICSSTMVKLENAGKYCYENNWLVRNSVDSVEWFYAQIKDYSSQCHHEPNDSNWVQQIF